MPLPDHAGHGADVDDVTRALPAHDRQHGAGEVRHAIEVGGELPLDVGCGHLLEIAEEAVARVIDQDVDAPEASNGGVDRSSGLGCVGDIEFDERNVLADGAA